MNKKLTVIGLVVTFLFILAATILVYMKPADLKLNEWGDFVAGFASPIALLWVVLGFLQQGEELRLNTQALNEQQEELKQQKEALEWIAAQAKRIAEKR